MKYRRVVIPGATYFFTLVTYQRRPIFSDPVAVEKLRAAFRFTMERMPFMIVASVILLDHMHFIWTLPAESGDFSTRWRLIKSQFTHHYLTGNAASESASREKKRESDVWQRRFWEHWIRDEADLRNHVEYIHYNPVKHGLAKTAAEWKCSSFMKYVQDGIYPVDWAGDVQLFAGERFVE